MRRPRLPLGIAAAALIGCGGEVTPQLLRAEIMSDSFPSLIVELRALSASGVVATAPHRDGETSVLAIPPGDGYQLTLITTDRRALLLQDPSGSATFSVCDATEPFELGRVEHACRVHLECEDELDRVAGCQEQFLRDCEMLRQVQAQCYEDIESMCHQSLEALTQCEELVGPDECVEQRFDWEQCQHACFEIDRELETVCEERCLPIWEHAMGVCAAPPTTCPEAQGHGVLSSRLPAAFGCEGG